MPFWTLRLVASAGVVALLGRLPESPHEALVLSLGVCLLAFGGLVVADALPRVRHRRPTSTPDSP